MEKDQEKDAKTRLVALELYKDSEKRRMQLARADAKLESIKNALPNYRTTALWEAGPTTLVQKIRAIIDAP